MVIKELNSERSVMELPETLPELVEGQGCFALRAFRPTDAPALEMQINSSRIAERVANVPSPYTRMHAESWISHLNIEHAMHQYTRRMDFVIDVGGSLVGSVAFINIDGHKAQLSYWLGEAYQGRGIMAEAVRMAVAFGLRECGWKRIWAYTHDGNYASQSVLKRAGFELEGIHRKEWLKDGRYRDSWMYAIVV